MKVSQSLFVPPIKFFIVLRVVLSECRVILFGLRFHMAAFWWLFMELFWLCSGPFRIVWSVSI